MRSVLLSLALYARIRGLVADPIVGPWQQVSVIGLRH